jgi:tripartite-type tricarboxylate transporter receptor subunit TctC
VQPFWAGNKGRSEADLIAIINQRSSNKFVEDLNEKTKQEKKSAETQNSGIDEFSQFQIMSFQKEILCPTNNGGHDSPIDIPSIN